MNRKKTNRKQSGEYQIVHRGRNSEDGQEFEGSNRCREFESQGLTATGFRGAKTSAKPNLLPMAPE
jgi:hypothetical protein